MGFKGEKSPKYSGSESHGRGNGAQRDSSRFAAQAWGNPDIVVPEDDFATKMRKTYGGEETQSKATQISHPTDQLRALMRTRNCTE